ncbi:MAG: hypothetical protein ACKVE4_11070 [Dissulfuribacterales bacterium]
MKRILMVLLIVLGMACFVNFAGAAEVQVKKSEIGLWLLTSPEVNKLFTLPGGRKIQMDTQERELVRKKMLLLVNNSPAWAAAARYAVILHGDMFSRASGKSFYYLPGMEALPVPILAELYWLSRVIDTVTESEINVDKVASMIRKKILYERDGVSALDKQINSVSGDQKAKVIASVALVGVMISADCLAQELEYNGDIKCYLSSFEGPELFWSPASVKRKKRKNSWFHRLLGWQGKSSRRMTWTVNVSYLRNEKGTGIMRVDMAAPARELYVVYRPYLSRVWPAGSKQMTNFWNCVEKQRWINEDNSQHFFDGMSFFVQLRIPFDVFFRAQMKYYDFLRGKKWEK